MSGEVKVVGLRAIGFLVAALVSFAPAASEAKPKKADTIRYELVMSEDDHLCRPLLSFYNAHLNDRDDERLGFIEDQFAKELRGDGPKFLINEGPYGGHQVLQSIDIYNDGSSRTVVLEDEGIGTGHFETVGTFLAVMRPGAPPLQA